MKVVEITPGYRGDVGGTSVRRLPDMWLVFNRHGQHLPARNSHATACILAVIKEVGPSLSATE